MRISERVAVVRLPILVPSLPSLRGEVGKRKALPFKAVPNLPSLPSLFFCAHMRTHPHARAHVYACEQSVFRLGRLGRLGTSSVRAAFNVPTSKKRVGRLGTPPGFPKEMTMDEAIVRMRRDFDRVLAFKLARGQWTRADSDEIGLAIRGAIDSQAEGLVFAWAAWCAVEAASYFGPAPALPPRSAVSACGTCAHLARPGRAYPGYCAERIDQPPAYGEGHPLRQLPPDQGAACAHWRIQ